jgi:hypothetical protein
MKRGGGPGRMKMCHLKEARCITDGRCTLIHDDTEMTGTGSKELSSDYTPNELVFSL